MLDNMNELDLELCECTRLISNTFTINSAGISPATRQRQQQAKSIRGRMNMPRQMNFDVKCDSPGKENMGEEDISFYSTLGLSPSASPRQCHTTSPSIYAIDKNVMHCNSQDTSSMDSGYSGLHHPESSNNVMLSSSVESQSTSAFTFLKPMRPSESSFASTSPPSQQHATPSKYSMTSGGSCSMVKGFKVFNSLSSGSMESNDPDEEFMELMEMENMDEDAQMPSDLKSLFNKDIKNSRTPDSQRPNSAARKCLNMNDIFGGGRKKLLFGSPSTPKSSTITSLITTPERQCLAPINENITPYRGNAGGFKRPEPPSASQSPVQNKRLKYENESLNSAPILPLTRSPQFPLQLQQAKRPIFRKSVSMNDAAIMNALQRSTSEPNLIGDCSLPFSLPIVEGKHNDLKSISADTMRRLLVGEYNDRIESYQIIDCRYPYEYEGGHIEGAINLYTQEQIIEHLVKNKTETPTITAGDKKRHILVFHCEFSSERGPKLSRFLRNHDRAKNENSYPALHYPEIYLLHNGYKEFFQLHGDLCTPNSYRTMLDVNYSEEYRQFRAKSKSWGGDGRGPGTNRLTKTRSRLVL